MTNCSEFTEELRSSFILLESNIKANEEKIQAQHKVYTDLYRIFLKHANKLATVANALNQEVLVAAQAQQTTLQHYQLLSNSLLRLADSSRRVSLRLKSEILDPLKTFNENYDNVYEDIRKQFEAKIELMTLQEVETIKHRDSYNQACEKFEKHRQMQKKVIEKIESGNKSQLQKFNLNTKKLTEAITSAEKFYLASVQKTNLELQHSRRQFAIVSQSISYNEDTRRSFFRKTIINSIKTLEQFSNAYDPEGVRKLQQSAKGDNPKFEDPVQRRIRVQLEKALSNDYREQFVSYGELMKRKKKKTQQDDSSHLSEYFSKLRDREKKQIQQLAYPWFLLKNPKKNSQNLLPSEIEDPNLLHAKSSQALTTTAEESRQKSSEKNKRKEREQADACRQKIISSLPHSLYFVQTLYGKVVQMTSFYCKLGEENFLFLLNAFSIISNHLDWQSDVGIQFVYKMMIVSQRIMLRKQTVSKNSNQTIELLCQKYGKNVPLFKELPFLSRLLAYIQKRKATKKKINTEPKGALNIAKGFLASFGRNKAPALNQDEQYNCLQEMIVLIANFSVPNEVILPFIKEAVGSVHQGSYEYLKSIILLKKDVEERQSLFYRREIKEKKEQLMRRAIDSKRQGQYAIQIVAEHGYLGMEELEFRFICRQLKDIHLQILSRLPLPTEKKWIRLIPVNHALDYISMKQQVAEKSVPSAVEEIITLDVNRSLHLHGESLNPTILHSLLRTYAYFHQDISYCQGMNYLAGYLYIKTRHQEHTYRIFQHLMERRFKEIFVNEFEVLKLKMYQFQRLLAIFHPEISEHFKRQSISPECYIVSWIITLFASSYQYTLRSYLIDTLWERFIIWGWPQFFRFVLWVFSLYKEDLVELTYDKALHFLGELSRSQLFLSDEKTYKQKFPKLEDPRAGVERYPVSQDLLNKFTAEYNLDQE